MRRHRPMLELVRGMHERGGVVAMICHAGWVPISAGIVKGKQVTSVSAIKDDLSNAGAQWLDQEVVRDGNLISSRFPDSSLLRVNRSLVKEGAKLRYPKTQRIKMFKTIIEAVIDIFHNSLTSSIQ
mgnify:CR=1 FL=1